MDISKASSEADILFLVLRDLSRLPDKRLANSVILEIHQLVQRFAYEIYFERINKTPDDDWYSAVEYYKWDPRKWETTHDDLSILAYRYWDCRTNYEDANSDFCRAERMVLGPNKKLPVLFDVAV